MVVILNKLEALGLFPYKVNDDFVEATRAWKIIVKIFIWLSGVFSLLAFIIFHYFETIIEWANIVNQAVGSDSTDLVALILMSLSVNITFCWLLCKNTRMNHEVAAFLNFLQSVTRYKYSPKFISAIFLPMISGVALGFSQFYPLLNGDKYIGIILYTIFTSLLFTINFSAIFAFVWSFSAILEMLSLWISKIQGELFSKKDPTENIIRLTQDGLKKANKVFSDTLVVLISLMLICVILASYATLSRATNTDYDIGRIIFILGYLICDVMIIRILYDINSSCQKVMDSIGELKEELILNDYNSISKPVEVLNTFEGFDCNGYFTLGRPLLTSITATFVTYIIILLQFKISE